MSEGTGRLRGLGQSVWLDNITRGLLASGTLRRYATELSVTGLTSNPSIFNSALRGSGDYDAALAAGARRRATAEELFFDLAIEDLAQAADLFLPVFERTAGVDGWVSLEVSPLLAHDAAGTVAAARALHAGAGRPNLFIKIPGTPEGLAAVEEAVFAGVPVNVTLLFSREHYLGAAEAYTRAIERRVEAGLDPRVASVASLFVSRWDVAVRGEVGPELRNRLGIAVAQGAYRAYRDLLASDRWQRLANFGARPQRLLWASTGTKDPEAPADLYVGSLAAPHTVNTMPEKTLLHFAERGAVGPVLSAGGGSAGETLARFERAGVDLASLAARLQKEGAEAFAASWSELLSVVAEKAGTPGGPG